jgi:hypothetical protein
VFAGTKAIDVATAAVERFKSLRLNGAAAATVNPERNPPAIWHA